MTMIPDNWREVSLADIVTCQGGCAFSPAMQGRTTGEIPFFKVSDMNLPQNQWVMRQANNYVTNDDRKNITGAEKPAGSVIFPKVGATIFTNKKRLLSKRAFVDNNVMAVWLKDGTQCVSPFLYLYFLTVPLAELCNPGPLPSINNGKVYERTIMLPPVPEQTKIAAVMWKIRRAIEVQEKLIVTARELKQSVIRELFTRGLRGNPQKETEIGPLPNNWDVVRLGDQTSVVSKGASPKWQGFQYAPSGVLFVRSQNVGEGRMHWSDKSFLPTAWNEKEKRSILKAGDVLVNLVGASIGRAAVGGNEIEGANCNQAVSFVRLKPETLIGEFLVGFLLAPEGQRQIHTTKKDIARANLSLEDVRNLRVPRPEADEQRDIADIVRTIDLKMLLHERKHAALQELFKKLLHQLMTSQIRVNDLDIDTCEVEATN